MLTSLLSASVVEARFISMDVSISIVTNGLDNPYASSNLLLTPPVCSVLLYQESHLMSGQGQLPNQFRTHHRFETIATWSAEKTKSTI